MNRPAGFFLLLSVWVPLSLGASPLGLLDQPQTFPWSVGLTPVVQEESGGLAPGGWRWRTSALWFNTYRQAGYDAAMTQRVDMEGLLGTVSAAWAPTEGVELRAQAQGWTLGGGVMDPALQAFHQFLGVANQGRELTSANGYRDYLKGTFDDQAPASGLTQASLAIRGFSGPWSGTVWVKPPVEGHLGWGWSGRWGGGAGAGWGDRWPWPEAGLSLRAGLSAALVAVEDDPSFPGQTGNLSGQGGLWAVVETFAGPRILAQGTWTSVPRSGEGYLPQGAGLLTVGTQWPLGSVTLEVAVTEEFLTWATTEVGFQVGLAWLSP